MIRKSFAAWLLLVSFVAAQQPTQRPRYVLHEPIVITKSWQTLENCILERADDFQGGPLVVTDPTRRLSHITIRDVCIDDAKSDYDGAGIELVNVAASVMHNVKVLRTEGPGIILNSVWNVDLVSCQCMYCGQDAKSPACLITSVWAESLAPDRSPSEFWRQATNDVRILGGRFEGSIVQLQCIDTTDVVVIGTKLHGDPNHRLIADNLCELVNPRGPHVFRAMTLAHGAEPQFRIEWGDKQAHVSIDAVDSDWPLNKPRDLVGERNAKPSGSDLEILKRVNAR